MAKKSQASDYVRVSKSDPQYNQRWYVNKKTGARISRRAYQTLSNSGISPNELAKIRKAQRVDIPKRNNQNRLNALVSKYKKETAAKLGIKPSQVKVRGQSQSAIEFRAKVRRLKQLNSMKDVDKTADGELARLLVDLNFRKPEWNMPVNESPREDG